MRRVGALAALVGVGSRHAEVAVAQWRSALVALKYRQVPTPTAPPRRTTKGPQPVAYAAVAAFVVLGGFFVWAVMSTGGGRFRPGSSGLDGSGRRQRR